MKFATSFQHFTEVIIIPEVVTIIPKFEEIKVEEVFVPVIEEIKVEEVKIEPIIEAMQVVQTDEYIEAIINPEIKIEPIIEAIVMQVEEITIADELIEVVDEEVEIDVVQEMEVVESVPDVKCKKNKKKSKYGTLKQAFEAKNLIATNDESFSIDSVYEEFDDIPDEFQA